jgi:hypothetical protein
MWQGLETHPWVPSYANSPVGLAVESISAVFDPEILVLPGEFCFGCIRSARYTVPPAKPIMNAT